MKVKVVYIETEKAKRINAILAMEKDFHDHEKENMKVQDKRKAY